MNPASNRKVLIVDDNQPVREIIAYHLEKFGFNVRQADNGRTGLDMFFQDPADLVLLDLRMPGLDGIDVLASITQKSPDTPVIILSGLGTTNDIIIALRLGAWDYLTKPIDSMVLQHAVFRAIERRDLLLQDRYHRENLEKEVAKRTSELVQRSEELEEAYTRLKKEINERKAAEEAVRDSEAKLRVLLNASSDPILLMDIRGEILDINESMAREIGKDADQIIGTCAWDSYPPETTLRRRAVIETVARTGKPQFIEVERQNKWHDIAIYPIFDADQRVTKAAVFCRDVTNRKWLEEELRALSITDELTGLFNRRGVLTLAQKQIKMAERLKSNLFLLYIDCDNMKWLNDHHGHKIGDQALIETAAILKETFRDADVIGRIGGDEFVIVLNDKSNTNDEQSVIKRLEEKFAARNAQTNRIYTLSISTGTVRYDFNNPCSIKELLAKGDALMYECKMYKKNNGKVQKPLPPNKQKGQPAPNGQVCEHCQQTFIIESKLREEKYQPAAKPRFKRSC